MTRHDDPSAVALEGGMTMPRLGLGVYMISDPDECQRSVEAALASGYRLVDTAVAYGNERAVGRGIAASGVSREDVFVTSKVWIRDFDHEKTAASIDASLERLGTGYVDLMLLHQPFPDYSGAWRAMEEAVDAGKLRAIGVSNFTVADLENLLPKARTVPVVDQIELHPYYQRRELVDYLRERGIAVESWSPLGHGSSSLLAEPLFAGLATRHRKTVAQVIVRWHIQTGFVTIPKSTNPDHIAANLDVFDFALTEDDMAAILALDKGRPHRRIPRWLQEIVFPQFRPRELP